MKIEHVTKNGLVVYFIMLIIFALSLSSIHIYMDNIPIMVAVLFIGLSAVAHIFTLFVDFVEQRKRYRLLTFVYLLLTGVCMFACFFFDVPFWLCVFTYMVSHLYRIQGNRLILPSKVISIIESENILLSIAVNELFYNILFYIKEYEKEYEFFLNNEFMNESDKLKAVDILTECGGMYCDEISVKNKDYNLVVKMKYTNFESVIENINKLKNEIDEQERRIKS